MLYKVVRSRFPSLLSVDHFRASNLEIFSYSHQFLQFCFSMGLTKVTPGRGVFASIPQMRIMYCPTFIFFVLSTADLDSFV